MPKFSDEFEFNDDEQFDELLQRAEEREFLESLEEDEGANDSDGLFYWEKE